MARDVQETYVMRGKTLDHMANFHGMKRKFMESDRRLRRRILDSIVGTKSPTLWKRIWRLTRRVRRKLRGPKLHWRNI
jgi:hypothetical protein